MENVTGTLLITLWRTLDDSGKEAIVTQLRQHLDEIRSLPSPDYFGGICGQETRDGKSQSQARMSYTMI